MPAVSLNRLPMRARGVCSIGKGLSVVGLVGSFFFSLPTFEFGSFWSGANVCCPKREHFQGLLGLSFYRWEGLLPHTVIYAMSIPRDSNERSHLLFGF
jgi:hypothetical protein